MLSTLLAEPPLRRVVQFAARHLPVSIRTRDRWNAADRPHYLAGLLYAADQATREGRDAIAAVEFGVAEGYGLLTLQAHAAAVERATGVRVAVYGFDSGGGLPVGTGDYRDHPDVWAPGDYKMDVAGLKAKLANRTTLVIGEIGWMVTAMPIREPIGFVAVDVDYYTSAVSCLRVFDAGAPRLHRVAMYFDDISAHYNHRAGGELLAIREFNDMHAGEMVIDPWRGVRAGRPFPDAVWLDAMYLAHDLTAISRTRLTRGRARMR